MRGVGIFLIGTSGVLYVADGISINAGKGVVWPAFIIGCMTFGAGVFALIASSRQ